MSISVRTAAIVDAAIPTLSIMITTMVMRLMALHTTMATTLAIRLMALHIIMATVTMVRRHLSSTHPLHSNMGNQAVQPL